MKYEIWITKTEIWNIKPESQNMKYDILNLNFELWNLKYEIWKLKYQPMAYKTPSQIQEHHLLNKKKRDAPQRRQELGSSIRHHLQLVGCSFADIGRY